MLGVGDRRAGLSCSPFNKIFGVCDYDYAVMTRSCLVIMWHHHHIITTHFVCIQMISGDDA